jgi:putative oxidoreductase
MKQSQGGSMKNAICQHAASACRLAICAVGRIAPLVTRIVVGQAYAITGLGKLQNIPRTTEYFAGLGIPMPEVNAVFVGCVELVGGLALILGLGTRAFAALLASTMVVALMTGDRADFLGGFAISPEKNLIDISAFAYLLFLLWLIAHGPGRLSLDALIARIWARQGCCGAKPQDATTVLMPPKP